MHYNACSPQLFVYCIPVVNATLYIAPSHLFGVMQLNMYLLRSVWTHAGALVPMDMTPDTKTRVPTIAAGSSQAV